MTAPTLREIPAWQDLGRLIAKHHLEPVVGFNYSNGRAYVRHGETILWAHVGTVRLDPFVPGANAIQSARVAAFAETLPPVPPAIAEQVRNMPDPLDSDMDRELEKQGRL